MKMIILFALLACVFIGCFDTSPPPGVVGDIVGCISVDDDLYCTTKYTDRGVSTGVDVMVGEIEFAPTNAGSVSRFHIHTTYRNEKGQLLSYAVFVESLRFEQIIGYENPTTFKGAFVRLTSGDTVAVAITEVPTTHSPHRGYIIRNLTRPEVEFEIPADVDDIVLTFDD